MPPTSFPSRPMTSSSTSRMQEGVFLTLLVVLGVGLRTYRIDTGLWFDEIVTLLDSVRQPLRVVVTHFPGDNDHPLYSLLAHISVGVFGESPLALRMPALLFGVAAIPMLYVLGTAVTSRREAAAAALVLTVSYHHIWFSQNARAYTLLLFCVLVSTHALVRFLEGGRGSALVLYAVVTALGAYAHLTMVIVSVGQAVACGVGGMWWDPSGRVRREWRSLAASFVAAGGLTLLLYAPMLTAMDSFLEPAATVEASPAATSFGAALSSAMQGLRVGFGSLWGIALAAAIAVVGAYSLVRARTVVALLLLLPAPLTVCAAVALQRPIRPRFVFFAAGFALLLGLRGAAVLGRLLSAWTGRLPPAAAASAMVTAVTVGAVVLSVGSLPYGYRLPKQDYAGAVRLVEQSRRDGEVVAMIGETTATPIGRYLGRSWERVDTHEDLQALRAGNVPVWVVYTFPSYIQTGRPLLWEMLRDQCVHIADFDGTVSGGSVSVRRCS